MSAAGHARRCAVRARAGALERGVREEVSEHTRARVLGATEGEARGPRARTAPRARRVLCRGGARARPALSRARRVCVCVFVRALPKVKPHAFPPYRVCKARRAYHPDGTIMVGIVGRKTSKSQTFCLGFGRRAAGGPPGTVAGRRGLRSSTGAGRGAARGRTALAGALPTWSAALAPASAAS